MIIIAVIQKDMQKIQPNAHPSNSFIASLPPFVFEVVDHPDECDVTYPKNDCALN